MCIPLLYCTAIIFLFSAISVWSHFHSWEMYFLREHLSVCREKFGSRSAFATKQKGIHYCAWHTSVLCTASSRRLNIPHNDNWDGMTFFSTSKHVSPTHILGDNDLWYLFRLSLPLERADNMQRRRTFERFLSATLFPFPARSTLSRRVSAAEM